MEGRNRAYAGRPPGRNPAGQHADREEQQNNGESGKGIVGRDTPKQADDGSRYGKADDDPDGDAWKKKSEAVLQNHLEDIGWGGSEGHADSDFVGAAGGGIGEDAVDANGDEHEADGAEDGQQQEAEARTGVGEGGDKAFECAGEGERDVAVGMSWPSVPISCLRNCCETPERDTCCGT